MRQHIITRQYQNLKGFSTESIYLRPPNVSESAINIHRDPDGSFSPRRGYQCETADIGGMGLTSFDSPCRCGVELICVHRDGNLYRRVTNKIFLSYNTASTEAWLQFSIFTNPNIYNNSPGWNTEPWSITPWAVPSGESIAFQAYIRSAAVVVGNQSLVNVINVRTGHVINVGDNIVVSAQENLYNQTRLVTATTANTITFSGGPLTVLNNDRLDIFVEQLFLRGFDVPTSYSVFNFVNYLNTITGVSAYTEGLTNVPAAFIPIQEFTNLTTGTDTELEYYYWEKIPCPVNPLLPGSGNSQNQNSLDFENANFCVYDEVLYCTNGYDFPVKYDGQNAYLAGMPKGDRPFVSKNSDGSLTADNIYYYAITYEQKDNATHLIEGEISNSFPYLVGATPERTDVRINTLEANSRYNTNAALATAAIDRVYGPDAEGNYYHFMPTQIGQTLIVGDTAYYQDRLIGQVNWSAVTPTTGTNLPVDPGYGILVGDTISFLDASGETIRRLVVDIDMTVVPNQIEIAGASVDTGNNPALSANVESPVYGHIGIASTTQLNTTTINLLSLAGVNNNLINGELVSFTDANGNFVQRTIVTRASGSIVIDEPISVLAGTLIWSQNIDTDQITLKNTKLSPIVKNFGDPYSNNLRINIYRSRGSTDGSLVELALIDSIPNDSFADNITYLDNLKDAELGIAFNQGDPNNPPPKCKYIFTFQNMIIYAGGSRNPNETEWSPDTFYFSKGTGPEYVPAATNFAPVPANDDNISGVNQSGSCLIIGKDRSIYAISGDLLTSQFQVTAVAPGSNIGVASHATMKPVGNLLYFMHTSGVYSMAESQMFPTDKNGDPIAVTKDIDVLFRSRPFDKYRQFVFKRAIALTYTPDGEYWLFLPCENQNGTLRNANENSILLCYDYKNQDWFKWNGINAAGGFAILDQNAFWQERRFSGFVGNTANLYRQHRNFRLIDYADHTRTIPVYWASGWEDLNYPQVRKKFIRAMLYIDRIDSLYQLNEPFLFFGTYLDRFPNNKDTSSAVTTINNSSQWGKPWSWTEWSGVDDPFIRVNLKSGTTSKSMQISLEMNKLNTSFKFNGFQLEVAPEYEKTFVR